MLFIDNAILVAQLRSFVRLLLRAGVQSILNPRALRPLCQSNAPAKGEEGNWWVYAVYVCVV